MNFAAEIVDAADPGRLAMIELRRDGERREWTFGEVSRAAAGLAGTFRDHGVGRGDVVVTVIGNRAEWVLAMMACFRLGAVVLPCTEQLRSKDLRLRFEAAGPALIVADRRDLDEVEGARDGLPLVVVPDDDLFAADPAPAADLKSEDPCLITFTSGTSGQPKGVLHCQRYLTGQGLQATEWLTAGEGELVWCTAASGWSKSARNVFIAPWLRGATALLHDARFDPEERLEIVEREGVAVLCMAPTEYRVIAKRAQLRPLPRLRTMVAAGEALDPDTLRTWRDATGVEIRDGYGQTETGQVTAIPLGEVKPGSMGLPLPGVSAWTDDDGELVLDPRTVPTFFRGYLGEEPWDRATPWHTGDRVRQDADGYLFYEGRNDDVIVSAGYRIGPFEVESALMSHPAVAEAAAVAAPDEERGSVVRAIVVLTAEGEASDQLRAELQEHVKAQTAPYKYPRILEFAETLPRTDSGKLRRSALRLSRI